MCMLLGMLWVHAQKKQISLTVYDISTFSPIENVVVLNGESNASLGKSDKNGQLKIALSSGFIIVHHPDYINQEVILLSTNSESEISIDLRPSQNSL